MPQFALVSEPSRDEANGWCQVPFMEILSPRAAHVGDPLDAEGKLYL
jgi:hypothetical protein